jgi:hypothetical protein
MRFIPICETKWIHHPKNRNLGFFIAKAKQRTPRVMVFPDIRPEKTDKGDETVTE